LGFCLRRSEGKCRDEKKVIRHTIRVECYQSVEREPYIRPQVAERRAQQIAEEIEEKIELAVCATVETEYGYKCEECGYVYTESGIFVWEQGRKVS